MKDNNVWDLVPLPEGAKLIGYEWIFKTKKGFERQYGDIQGMSCHKKLYTKRRH